MTPRYSALILIVFTFGMVFVSCNAGRIRQVDDETHIKQVIGAIEEAKAQGVITTTQRAPHGHLPIVSLWGSLGKNLFGRNRTRQIIMRGRVINYKLARRFPWGYICSATDHITGISQSFKSRQKEGEVLIECADKLLQKLNDLGIIKDRVTERAVTLKGASSDIGAQYVLP